MAAEAVTLDEAVELLKARRAAGPSKKPARGRKAPAKKAAAKAPAAKKAATKSRSQEDGTGQEGGREEGCRQEGCRQEDCQGGLSAMDEWLFWLTAEYGDQIEMSLRLCVATIAGMIVGINRDIHNKPIGMRTLGLVSLGSAIVILSGSVYEGLHFGQDAVSRVIQGILTGLGFLGAGSILRAKDGTEVQGLTTAATVWIAARSG